MKKLLITGISGLLGSNLAYYFKDKYDVTGFYHKNRVAHKDIKMHAVDMTRPDDVKHNIDLCQPDIIIHCAALADIDQCEEQPELARRCNVETVGHIVNAIKGSPTKLIFISSDAVYDGKKDKYCEDDAVGPLSVYGRTKVGGEQQALKAPRGLVARTNLIGWNILEKRHLAEWMIHELSAGRPIKGFTDVYFAAIYTFKLAELLAAAMAVDLEGVYHFAGSNAISKHDCAVLLAELYGLDKKLIEPISVDQFKLKAKRAKNLILDVSKLQTALHRNIPTVEESLRRFHTDDRDGLPQRLKQEFAV